MASYRSATRPSNSDAIAFEHGVAGVPGNPVISCVEGDGTGPDIVPLRSACSWQPSRANGKRVTYHPARQMSGATEVSTSSFGDEIIKGMRA
jgi:isocitrate dehydrogenase